MNRIYYIACLSVLFSFSFLVVISYCQGMEYNHTISSYGTVNYTLNWLHTEGRWIKDNLGRKVILKGAATSGIDYIPELPNEWSQMEISYKAMAEAGANVIRLAINPAFTYEWWTETGTFECEQAGATYWNTIDTIVGWCKKYNMWVIIDFHTYVAPPYNDTSVERWVYGSDANYLHQQYLENTTWINEMVTWWSQIANRYKDEPTVVGYGVGNEFFGWPPDEATKNYWFNLFRNYVIQVSAAIHEVNPHALIFVQNPLWCSNRLNDWIGNWLEEPNVVYCVHRYYYYDQLYGADGCEHIGEYGYLYRDGQFEEAKIVMEQCYQYILFDVAEVYNKPVLLEEYGVITFDCPNWEVQMEDLLTMLEEHEVGHIYWRQYRGEDGSLTLEDCKTLSPAGEIWARHLK